MRTYLRFGALVRTADERRGCATFEPFEGDGVIAFDDGEVRRAVHPFDHGAGELAPRRHRGQVCERLGEGLDPRAVLGGVWVVRSVDKRLEVLERRVQHLTLVAELVGGIDLVIFAEFGDFLEFAQPPGTNVSESKRDRTATTYALFLSRL